MIGGQRALGAAGNTNLKRRGDRAGALAAFRTTVVCKPQFVEAHINLGELLADDGRLVMPSEPRP